MVIIYLDNILIYSNNLIDYKRYIKKVLEALKIYGLFIKLEKYKFEISIVKFLGYIISTNSISIDPERVVTILD